MQYIAETWLSPPLMPCSAYERAGLDSGLIIIDKVLGFRRHLSSFHPISLTDITTMIFVKFQGIIVSFVKYRSYAFPILQSVVDAQLVRI